MLEPIQAPAPIVLALLLFGSWAGRRRRSGAYELSLRTIGGSALEPHDQSHPERGGHPLKRGDAGLMASALQTVGRRITGPDATGQFLLGQAQSASVQDHDGCPALASNYTSERLEGERVWLESTSSA